MSEVELVPLSPSDIQHLRFFLNREAIHTLFSLFPDGIYVSKKSLESVKYERTEIDMMYSQNKENGSE